MPLPKIEDARKLSNEELTDAILTAKRELFELRLQQATRRLEKPHQFKHTKHRIAQMMTVIRERELAASEQEATETSEVSSTASSQTSDEAASASQSEQEEE